MDEWPRTLLTVSIGTPLLKVTVVAKVWRPKWVVKVLFMPQSKGINNFMFGI